MTTLRIDPGKEPVAVDISYTQIEKELHSLIHEDTIHGMVALSGLGEGPPNELANALFKTDEIHGPVFFLTGNYTGLSRCQIEWLLEWAEQHSTGNR